MPEVKVGAQLPPQHVSMSRLRDAWQRADDMGVDSIWIWDHFFPLYGDPDGMHFEGLAILAAMAESTTPALSGPRSTRSPRRTIVVSALPAWASSASTAATSASNKSRRP